MILDHRDKVGKVYTAELDSQGNCTLRRCLVCGELFSRDGAQRHAMFPCRPKKPHVAQQPERTQ